MRRPVLKYALSILLPLGCAAALATPLEDVQGGSYSQDALGQIAQSAPVALAEDGKYQVSSYPAFQMQLADGPGRGETQISCSSCHTPRYILMQPPLPAATWDAEVRKMIKTYGAQISDADTQKITQYLQAHYTPETRK
jgi:hypothetical protein